MKKVNVILGKMQASLNGSLDGLEFDNTCDVIEKSVVVETLKDLMVLVNEAQQQVKLFSLADVSVSVLSDKDVMEAANSYANECYPEKREIARTGFIACWKWFRKGNNR